MDPAEGVVQRAPAGQYHEYRWETERVPYSLTLASNGGSTFSYTRAEPGAPVSLTIDPSWKMTVTPGTRTTYAGNAELALDPARVMEYTFTLALPEGMIWAEEVREALKSGTAELGAKVTSSGSSSGALWLDGMKLLSYSSVTSGTTVTGGTARLEAGELVITVRQAANTADGFSTSPGAVFALPGTMATVEKAESYNYSDTSKAITLDAVSEVQYSFGKPQSQEQRQIQWTSTPPSDKLTFGKTGEDSSGHIEYDGDNYYILTAANATLDDKPLRSISDPLPLDLLIPPAQIGQLFTLEEDEKGNALSNARLAAKLTLTITDARIYGYEEPQNALGMVTLTDGMTRYKLTADKTDAYGTTYNTQDVIIQKSNEGGSLSVKIGDAAAQDVPIGNLETHLQTHGFAVTAKTQYTVTWDFGTDYEIASGDTYTLRIQVAAKSSFQQLVDDQVVYRGADSASSSPSNYGKKQFKVTNTAEFTEATTTTPTSKSVSGYYYGDCAISKDSQEKEATTGDVLHYSVTVHQDSHQRGEDGVPVVDVMSGAQCLLAPAKANQGQSWAANMTSITKEGTEYYKLTLPESAEAEGRYTYRGIWLGRYYADSVTVIRYDELTEAEKQKYDHTGGSTSVGNAIAQDGYVTEIRWYLKSSTSWIDSSRTISYQALADTSLSVEGAPDAGKLKNIAYLNDRDGERLFYTTGVIPVRSVSGAKELLDADGNVLSGDTSIIGAGETVHYRLSVYNPTESEVLIPEEQIYDVLPSTEHLFTWTANQNVKVKGYAYKTSTETPAFEWKVTEGQLQWPKGVTVPAGDTLYIYVDLTFPQDAETDSIWDQYCTAAGSNTINNIFHLVNDTRTISHTLALPAQAYLQKGVQQMRYQYSNKSTGNKDISDLRFYPERSTGNFNYTTITYYALVYNGGEGPLYLTELQDRIESDAEKSVVHITSSSSPITPITSKLNLSGLPDSAQLVEAAITATQKTDEKGDLWVYTFAPSDKYSNMETLSYDAVAKAYYLQPGQVLAFTYQARVNGASDIAVNTLTMPAYDPHHAGVSMAENIQIKNNVKIKGKTLNDGSCDLWTEYEATQQQGFASDRHADSWLYSTVTLRKGNAVPGIQKEALKKRTISGDVSPCNGYAGSGDAVQWQVTVSSEGKNILNGYTITDTFPERYTLAAGDVQVTGNLGSSTDSYTLFTVQGYTMNSAGTKVQSIVTNNGTYTVGASEEEVQEDSYYRIYRVKFYYNTNDQLVMQLTVLDGGYGTVYPGMTSKLTYWTANYTSTLSYTTYLNTAVLTLPDQEIDYDDVTMGRILRDEDGNPTGIQARATVNVAGAYSTASSKTVTEEGDESNTTNSLAGGAIALTQTDSGHNGYTGFTYTLEVNNDLSGSAGSTIGIQWMTIIDNLPQIGDKLTLNQKEDRYSEFQVDFQTDPHVTVWYEEEDGTRQEFDKNDYTVRYSTKATGFTDADWGTLENMPGDVGWSETTTDARSIRVTLCGTEDAPVIPAGATVYVSFDCQVADQNADPGAIAWNSFGYRYQMKDDEMQLEASPLEVGVMIPDYPRIRKSLVTEELTEQQAVEDVTFRFLVYSGEAPTGIFNSGRELMDALVVDESRVFSLAEVKLTKDSSTNTLKLQNLMQYSYDKNGDKTLTPTNNPWVWTNGKPYTIVELGDNSHAWLGAYWDYDFYTLNDSEVNSYTFTYNKATSQLVDVVNRYTERALKLLKVDEKDADTKLAGAIFGLYSENQADQLTGDALTTEATKHGLTDAQKTELQGKTTVPVGEGDDTKTYYLCRLGKSDDYGQIFWDDLNRKNYCYQELWAPDGYLITQATPTTITFDENGNYIRVINQTITNKKFYNLPKTGGMGRWQLPLLGFGLCGAVVLVLGNKRRKKGKSFPS